MAQKWKYALWGIVLGAVLCAVVGFKWGGWETRSSSQILAQERANAALVKALTPICIAKFQAASNAPVKLDELKKISSAWARESFVKKANGLKSAASRTPQSSTHVPTLSTNYDLPSASIGTFRSLAPDPIHALMLVGSMRSVKRTHGPKTRWPAFPAKLGRRLLLMSANLSSEPGEPHPPRRRAASRRTGVPSLPYL